MRSKREEDRARVVHEHVDPAEPLHRGAHRGGDVGLLADVAPHRERPAALALHLLRRLGVGAGQLRVRHRGLGGDDDVRPLARGGDADGAADAAARAGDEERLPFQ
jgi:hypothetical protein